MRMLAALLVLTFASACGAPQQPEPAETAASAATLQLADAWAAPTPSGVDVSAGYLTIVNGTGAEDRLMSASSPRAERVELHEMSMDGGVMRMRAMEAVAIPAGGEAEFAPGGRHLMFFGVAQPFIPGEEIPVTLTFANAGPIEVTLPVRARDSAAHGDDGH